MKFQDMTLEQQEHLTKLIDNWGTPPEGCTHFDMTDSSTSSFIRQDTPYRYFWASIGRWDKLPLYCHVNLVRLPDPPYYLPESVALPEVKHKAKPPVQQKAIIQEYLVDFFGCSDREANAHAMLIMQEIL